MKSQLIRQKSNFDFSVNIKSQRSKFIKTFKNIKLDHQKVKKVKSQFENFIMLSKFFTMMQSDSRETSNMKVVYLHEIYNFYSHNSFQKFVDLKL